LQEAEEIFHVLGRSAPTFDGMASNLETIKKKLLGTQDHGLQGFRIEMFSLQKILAKNYYWKPRKTTFHF
jgi:hypothetical protein